MASKTFTLRCYPFRTPLCSVVGAGLWDSAHVTLDAMPDCKPEPRKLLAILRPSDSQSMALATRTQWSVRTHLSLGKAIQMPNTF